MFKKLLLPILLVVTILAWACFGAYLKYSVFTTLGLETKENIVSLPFVLLTDKSMKREFNQKIDELTNPTQPTQPPAETETQEPPTTETTVPAETEVVTVPTETEDTVPTEPPYVPVDDSWFDNALFIGESRVDGLKGNARLGEADYFSGTNLMVYDILEAKCSDRTFSELKLTELLSRRDYDKVYIHLGINECGSNIENFISQYQWIIKTIREKEPDACIILMSILPVTEAYATQPAFQPENLAMFNARIQELAADENMRFLDNNLWAADDRGFLIEDYTNDGCHPHGGGNLIWAQWIKEQAGWFGIE